MIRQKKSKKRCWNTQDEFRPTNHVLPRSYRNKMHTASNKLNIVVAGFIVGGPLGGLVWHHLQYVLGLHAMGHRVLFVEDSDDYPSCYNPQTNAFSEDPSYGLAFIDRVFTARCLKDHWAYYCHHSKTWYGVSEQKVKEFIAKADVFLNLSGVNPLREPFLKIPLRVFVDTDPAFTQIRHLEEPGAKAKAEKHNSFFTYGENFGKLKCSIPDDGFPWQPTRQPVFLPAWRKNTGSKLARWTTVMQWDSYKTQIHRGCLFGMKSASFTDYLLLPQKTTETFELAIGSASAPKEKLAAAGWFLANPLEVTRNPQTYQQYIQQSKGEWSVAKQGYVVSNSGWFSERTAGYLASGRPCVVQDTGFSSLIETGHGLFAFTSPEDSLACIEEVSNNYDAHCDWARDTAKEYFQFDKVLSDLLKRCTLSMATT